MTFQLDKAFWRNARLLLWSFIIMVAALDWANLIEIPAEIGGFMFLVYIVAGWVVAYHVLQRLRGS